MQLLHHGLLEQCGFGVTLPPPVADRFDTLYDDIRSENAGFTAGGIALPETTEALPDALAASFLVRPYAIGSINLKLRDLLLSLIARRDYYKSKLPTASSSSTTWSRALTLARLTPQSYTQGTGSTSSLRLF